MTKIMKLAVGPLQYFWQRNAVFAFYEAIAAAPVDIVYLGEVVCSKRREVRFQDWIALGRQLTAAGKQVVLSSLALLEAESELGQLAHIAANGEFLVEANDMAAVDLLSGSAFVAGPHLNVYNDHTLALLIRRGACRWVAPMELSVTAIADIRAACSTQIPVEIFAFGRIPLAFSARCFTARAHNRAKDDCELICREYPDGITLHSREHKPFLALNGIQTQSAATQNAIGSLHEIMRSGVGILRLSPQSQHFLAVIEAFHGALRGADTQAIPDAFLPGGYCDGYLHGLPGMSAVRS